MSVSLTVDELTPHFPDFKVALVVAENLNIGFERPAGLEAEIREREEECRRLWSSTELSAIPGLAVWRAAYRAFGIKKTSYRCSAERIVKNVFAGRELPRINAFVDAYNAASLRSVMCVGADDLEKAVGPFAFRFAREGDSFIDMAVEAGEDPNDPPKKGEVVYTDTRHVLCRRWNWRQDARTLVSPHTRRAIVTIQANGFGNVSEAAKDLAGLLEKYCGASCRTAIATALQSSVEV